MGGCEGRRLASLCFPFSVFRSWAGCRALPNVILVTLVLGVANDQLNVFLLLALVVLGEATYQPDCLHGESVGVWALGPWHGPGPFRGPSDEGLTKRHSRDFGVRGGQ